MLGNGAPLQTLQEGEVEGGPRRWTPLLEALAGSQGTEAGDVMGARPPPRLPAGLFTLSLSPLSCPSVSPSPLVCLPFGNPAKNCVVNLTDFATFRPRELGFSFQFCPMGPRSPSTGRRRVRGAGPALPVLAQPGGSLPRGLLVPPGGPRRVSPWNLEHAAGR